MHDYLRSLRTEAFAPYAAGVGACDYRCGGGVGGAGYVGGGGNVRSYRLGGGGN